MQVLPSPSYIANDHAQLQGHVVWRHPFRLSYDASQPTIACFSNFQKLSPTALDLCVRRAKGVGVYMQQQPCSSRNAPDPFERSERPEHAAAAV